MSARARRAASTSPDHSTAVANGVSGSSFSGASPRRSPATYAVDTAIRCAVAIQSKLAEHRRMHGFAPQVRVGVHATSATKAGGAYRGKGVHEAARIGSAAEAGEILASRSTLEAIAGRFAASPPRTVQLKGISQPVEVVAIDWRSAAT